jgi:lysophospholipase L1-like esterase
VKGPGVAGAGFGSVTNFGDSITCGYYALPNDGGGYMYSMEGYATLLDTALGVAAKDLCRGGDQAADMARLWVYPNTMPQLNQGQLYTVLIGTNDVHFCGPSPGCIANWSGALTASLAWLAVPRTDKVLASEMTASSGWAEDMDFGMSTSVAGETLSFDVQQAVAGRSLNVAYRVFDPTLQAGGVAMVSVDGEPVATLNASQAMATQNSTKDTIFVARLPLGAVGQHHVTITTGRTGTGAGAFFSILWAGVPTESYAEVSGAPTVVVGSVPLTGADLLNAIAAQYNAALTTLVAGLTADGMNLRVAPTGTALLPADMVDLLHPGNAGHAKLAAAFESVLQPVSP